MSFVKILVHAVWGTKYREPIMSKPQRDILFNHIRENAKAKKIHLISLGGFDDHVHCLIALAKDQSIAKTIQLLKGESSNWANKRNLFSSKLIWAEDYFAASVNAESIHRVKNYILNQERHHTQKSFEEEFELFKKTHGL